MKVFKTKTIAWILLFSVLIQGCTVYQKNSITIEEAIEAEGREAKRFKIITTDDRTLIFESIYVRDGDFYGLMKVEKAPDPVETRIYPASIKEIHLYDPKKSTTRIISGTSAVIIVLCILAVIGTVAFIVWLLSFDWVENN